MGKPACMTFKSAVVPIPHPITYVPTNLVKEPKLYSTYPHSPPPPPNLGCWSQERIFPFLERHISEACKLWSVSQQNVKWPDNFKGCALSPLGYARKPSQCLRANILHSLVAHMSPPSPFCLEQNHQNGKWFLLNWREGVREFLGILESK